jgi:outer membrane autotransporter protein
LGRGTLKNCVVLLQNGLTPFVKAGLGYTKVSNGGGNTTKARYGVGVMYAIDSNVDVCLDYTHNFKDENVKNNAVTVGVQMKY